MEHYVTRKKNSFSQLLLWMLLFSVFFGNMTVFSAETVEFGENAAWLDILSAEGVVSAADSGRIVLRLADIQSRMDSNTQLALSFDSGLVQEDSAHFSVKAAGAEITDYRSARGSGAGLFSGSPIVLQNNYADFFRPDTLQQGFTLSFHLYPAALRLGEEIFSWTGMDDSGEKNIVQNFSVVVEDRRLVVYCDNIFQDGSGEYHSARLSAYSGLLPRRWSHHFIRYDSALGLLEYYVDGILSASVYVTADGLDDGSGFPVRIGNLSGREVVIGDGFSGLLDDVLFSSRPEQLPAMRRIQPQPGSVVFAPYAFQDARVRIEAIDADFLLPGETAQRGFFRIGNRLNPDGNVAAEWKVLSDLHPGQERGRYLQLRFELLPDGNGENAPALAAVRIEYENLPPLISPGNVRLEAVENGLRLSWDSVYDPTVGGYRVYYGCAPGEYFGSDSTAGASPVDAGNQTELILDGLSPDKVYYISIVSYDELDHELTSAFSREIRGRPLQGSLEVDYDE